MDTSDVPQTSLTDQERAFVVDIGVLLSDGGLPPSVGRVLGLLLICRPVYQSAESMRQILQLSSGSVSTATTTLAKIQLVEILTFPGDRRLYYKLHDDAWQRMLEGRLRQAYAGIALVQKGLALQHDNARLQDLLTLYEQSVAAVKKITLA